MEKCQCVTAKGVQCSRKPISGSNYCKQHEACKKPITEKILTNEKKPITEKILTDEKIPLKKKSPLKINLTEEEFLEAIKHDDATFLSKYDLNIVAKFFKKFKFNVKFMTFTKMNTNLADLVAFNKINIISYALKNELLDPNEKDKAFEDPASINAARNGDYEIVKILLEDPRIDVNSQDKDRKTLLLHIISIISISNYEILKLLLNNPKIDVNLQDNQGNTALILATFNNNAENAKLLLNNPKIDVNLQNEQGHTALLNAINKNNVVIAKILLKNHKIDVNIKNKTGLTALLLAIKVNNANNEIVKILLENPEIDVNCNFQNSFNSLIVATLANNSVTVKILLKNPKIDVNWQNKDGNNALIIALKKNNNEIAEIFLEYPKIDVNLQDKQGNTALRLAIEEYDNDHDNYLPIIELLLKRKDIDLQKSGTLNYLIKNKDKYKDIIKLIKGFNWKVYMKKINDNKPKNLKNLPIQFYPPTDWTTWQKICHTIHGLPKDKMTEQVNQLRLLAEKANIPNYETISSTALCVELSKSFELYNDEIKKSTKVTCKNDSNLLGDDFADILPEQIIVDDHGYCFSLDEISELIKYGKHPFTNAPLKDVKVKGQPIIEYYNNLSKNTQKTQLNEIHKFYPSLEMELKQETIYEELLVDLINVSPDAASTKYLSAVQLGKYDNNSSLRSAILNNLMIQDLSIENKDILGGLFSVGNYMNTNISYIDFIKKLIEYINQMPSSNKETAKFLILELFKSHPPT